MKLKAKCPYCEISQMFAYKQGDDMSQVQCHMEWCRKTFTPAKSESKMYGPKEDSIDALRNAKAQDHTQTVTL